MKYRAEIDGLRTLAVIPVILFHAGYGLFSGGFVGVDIFFVISGYLITTILIEEIQNNRFSLVNFYERRARRILPALFFVMFVCIPFAWMWMLPSQIIDFSQSLVAVSLFSSNILFWKESDYFDTAAEEKPLLHTWSLAVEEQYYVLFPIFLLLAWRFGKSRVYWMIIVLAAMSLLLSEWSWRNSPTANFYLATTRAWELLAGSIAAFIVQKRGVQSSNALSILGLTAIVVAIFTYDETTPFPSAYALVPVIGAILLIIFADKATLAAKLLSTKVFVGIGLISFSAYLWHQPLFAFARIKLLEEPSDLLMGFLSIASIILAITSWKYVEKPFRANSNKFFTRKFIFSSSMAGLLAFIVVGYAGHKSDGFMGRFEIPETVYESIGRSKRQRECFGKNNIHNRSDWYCNIGVDSISSDILVFGDSHAVSFLPVIDSAAENLNLNGFFVGSPGCTPLLGIYALRADQNERNCHLLNKRVFEFVKDNGISTVILVARWSYYTDGGYSGNDFSYISINEIDNSTQEISRAAFKIGLKDTIEAYKRIGVRLAIVLQVPQQKSEPLDLYSSSIQSNQSLDSLSISLEEHLQLQYYVNDLFVKSEIDILDFTESLCSNQHCPVGNPDVSFLNP